MPKTSNSVAAQLAALAQAGLTPQELTEATETRLDALAAEIAAAGVAPADYAPWRGVAAMLPPADAERLTAMLAERATAAAPGGHPRPGDPVPPLPTGHWAGELPWTYPEEAISTEENGARTLDLEALTLWLAQSPAAPLRWLAPVNRGLWCWRPDRKRWVRGEDVVAALLARAAAPWGRTVAAQAATRAAEGIANLNLAPEHCLDQVLSPEAIPAPEGVLDPLAGELRPHAPEHYCTVQLAARWSADGYAPADYAAAERFLDQKLEEILPDPVDREGYLRICGIAATRVTKVQKFFVFLGEGSNGKSKLLAALTAMLGKENVSGETLQSLTERFGGSALEGKLANVCPDIPTERLRDVGTLKALVGGDYVRAERKYQPQFTFRNFATPIFSANTMPPADDHSYGFFRRLHIVVFSQKFEGEREDPNLEEKLTQPPVLTALLHRAVEALRRCAEENWQTPMSQAALAEVEEYRRNQDSLYAYAQECLVPDPHSYVFKDTLYTDYKLWAEDAHVYVLSQPAFFRRIRSLPGYNLAEYRPRSGADRRRALLGARLRTRYQHPGATGGEEDIPPQDTGSWPAPGEDPLP